MAAKIKKGDTVEIIAGKNKGEKGKVLKVGEERVTVEGINIQKRHLKPGARQNMPQGGVLDRPGPIHISNVRLYSEKLERGVRIGFTTKGDGAKVRVVRGRKGTGVELD